MSQLPHETEQQLETLQTQVAQLQEQVNGLLQLTSHLDVHAMIGLRPLGILLYFLFLPFRLARHLLKILTNPNSYWAGFYWLCFAWILILDRGWKELLTSFRHPLRLLRAFGLLRK
jgi:hypothetical protein